MTDKNEGISSVFKDVLGSSDLNTEDLNILAQKRGADTVTRYNNLRLIKATIISEFFEAVNINRLNEGIVDFDKIGMWGDKNYSPYVLKAIHHLAQPSDDQFNRSRLQRLAYCSDKLILTDFFLRPRPDGKPNIAVDRESLTTSGLQSTIFPCGNAKLCGYCALKASSVAAKELALKINGVINDGFWRMATKDKGRYFVPADPSLKVLLLTLTIKNHHDIAFVYNALHESWRSLMKEYVNCRAGSRGNYSIFRDVVGIRSAYEITKSESGFHPHIHAILIVKDTSAFEDYLSLSRPSKSKKGKKKFDKYAAQRKTTDLAKIWARHTKKAGIESFIVDVVEIDTSSPEKIIKSAAEVSKYMLKSSSLAPLDQLECYGYLITSGLRGKNYSGILRGIEKTSLVNVYSECSVTEDSHYKTYYQWIDETLRYDMIGRVEVVNRLNNIGIPADSSIAAALPF